MEIHSSSILECAERAQHVDLSPKYLQTGCWKVMEDGCWEAELVRARLSIPPCQMFGVLEVEKLQQHPQMTANEATPHPHPYPDTRQPELQIR